MVEDNYKSNCIQSYVSSIPSVTLMRGINVANEYMQVLSKILSKLIYKLSIKQSLLLLFHYDFIRIIMKN